MIYRSPACSGVTSQNFRIACVPVIARGVSAPKRIITCAHWLAGVCIKFTLSRGLDDLVLDWCHPRTAHLRHARAYRSDREPHSLHWCDNVGKIVDTCAEEADRLNAPAVVHKSRSEAEGALSFRELIGSTAMEKPSFHRNSVTDPGRLGVTVARKLKVPGRNAIADNSSVTA